ncbi:hypothetical protein [Arthrobacter sp.]|uniref:hypothetical protein n=1 Tax=Arthrobacter sp. TaxID=1667 RepID=UPI0026E0DDCD|nr:hypothetical protein [Arthrobacter sp.]MDO5752251.1 hypothetical protein [Arthrobacter sp.]
MAAADVLDKLFSGTSLPVAEHPDKAMEAIIGNKIHFFSMCPPDMRDWILIANHLRISVFGLFPTSISPRKQF